MEGGVSDLLSCKRGRKNWGPGEDSLEHRCCPSLAVNPVFDPAEEGKEASASRARPSVSGTRQSPATQGSGLSSCVAASGAGGAGELGQGQETPEISGIG